MPPILVFPRSKSQPAAQSIPNLEKYGDALISHLTYQVFFVGRVWKTDYLTQCARQLDAALQTSVTDPGCNQVFDQYFPKKGDVSATRRAGYEVVDVDWKDYVFRDDLEGWAYDLYRTGRLPTGDLSSFVLSFVLPPGTVLSIAPTAAESIGQNNSMEGLGAYHGRFDFPGHSGTPPIYFCVAVWSDGTNGAAVPAVGEKPAWAPWENACAALYHELGESRLCPNIDDAPPTQTNPPLPKLGWLVWYQPQQGIYVPPPTGSFWQEIGDLSIFWSGMRPQKVFCKRHNGDGSVVPIQALWSNVLRAPFFPTGYIPQEPH